MVLAAALTVVNVSACGGDPDASIQVAVVWSGYELERFREVVDGFEAENPHVSVDIVSAGDDIDAFLRARSRAGSLPDVAVLPQPGLIDDFVDQGWLEPLDPGLAARYDRFWQDLGTVGDDLYGVAVKASFKSLLWYQPDLVEASALTSWAALPQLVEERDGTGGPALLAVGAANGWVLTDWLENLLLAHDGTPPTVYRRLAAGEPLWCRRPVEEALVDLAGIWGVEHAVPGGGDRALLTDFDESVIQVAGAGEATLLLGSDFVESITSGVLATAGDEADLRWVRLPSPTDRQPALLGGDYAVVMDGGRAARDPVDGTAHEFVDWLARRDSFRPWIVHGGYYSPLRAEATGYPDRLAAELAGLVRMPPEGAEFDLSDQLEGETRARLESVLRTFFAEVAAGGGPPSERRVRRAADRARSALDLAVGGDECGG